MPSYSDEPEDPRAFTRSFDAGYTRFTRLYDFAVKVLPIWKGWLRHALPHVRGPRVLEVSFGTGYLLTQLDAATEAHGIDYNARMVATARGNLLRASRSAHLARATVEALPYQDASFDTVVNTMAFTGYPNAERSLAEMVRVLRPEGRFVMIDVNYPADGNWLGTTLTNGWKAAGDLIREMDPLFDQLSLDYTHEEIGGFGSVHLYLATTRS